MRQTLLIAFAASRVLALDNGLAIVPPMGINPYCVTGFNERTFNESMDVLIEEGLDKLGYIYVNVDEGWEAKARTADGRLTHNPETYPSGMKGLGDHIHSRGFKFGIYSDAGKYTCGLHPGSLGYEDVDAQTFAEWGVDLLKYDNCFINDDTCQLGPCDKPARAAILRYAAMTNALNKTGRPILFSLCNWGEEDVARWGPDVGNIMRTALDMTDEWSILVRNVLANDLAAPYARPGAWMDLDFLQVGCHQRKDTMNLEEQRSHFALWCIFKSPLIISADLRTIKPEELEILKNKELIAVNQDPASKQATCFLNCAAMEVKGYATTRGNGDRVAVMTNWGSAVNASSSFTLKDLGITLKEGQAARVTDLWDESKTSTVHKVDLPIENGALEPHQSKVVKVSVYERADVEFIHV